MSWKPLGVAMIAMLVLGLMAKVAIVTWVWFIKWAVVQ